MDGNIHLSAEQRKTLLRFFRCGDDVRLSRRAHIVLLLADGFRPRPLSACSSLETRMYPMAVFMVFPPLGSTMRACFDGNCKGKLD